MIDTLPLPYKIAIGIIVVITTLLLSVVSSWANRGTPYEKAPRALTRAEAQFYKALVSTLYTPALKGRVLIFPKMRLADVVNVKPNVGRRHWWGYFSKIGMKHLDFTIVERRSFQTVCAFELDDKSHQQKVTIKRDIFVNKVMSDVGIPLYRIPVRRRYEREKLEQMITQCLS